MKLTIIALVLSLLGCKAPVTQDNPTVLETPEYTLDEDIGMMLLVGFRGQEVDSARNPEIITALRDYHVGSVILFDYDVPTGTRGRNIKNAAQLKRLCGQLRALNPDLLIGIDQKDPLTEFCKTGCQVDRCCSLSYTAFLIGNRNDLFHFVSLIK